MTGWGVLLSVSAAFRPTIRFVRRHSGLYFLLSILVTIVLGVWLGPGRWMWFAAVVIGGLEVLWLSYADAEPKRPRKLRVHAVWFIVIVLVLSVGLPAIPRDSKSDNSLPDAAGLLFLLLLLIAAALFLRVTMNAVAWSTGRKDRGPLIALVKSKRRTRLELWYGYTGSVCFGAGVFTLRLDGAKAWAYVVAFGMAAVVLTCMWVVVHWGSLGDAKKEGGKLLVRQATLTCILCLSLIVQALDHSAGSVPLSVAVTSGIMLVPTVMELFTAVMRMKREKELAGKRPRSVDADGDGARSR